MHGISRERLQNEGLSLRQVADELNELLAGKTVYSDGWGVDRTWLARLFYEAGVIQAFKLESIYSKLTEEQLERWHRTREEVLKQTGMVPHRAGTDALIIQKTFLFAVLPQSQRGQQGVA